MATQQIAFIFSSMDSVKQLAGLLENMSALASEHYDGFSKEGLEWAEIFRDFAKGPDDPSSRYWMTPREK